LRRPIEYRSPEALHAVALVSPITIDPVVPAPAHVQTATELAGATGFWLNVMMILSPQSIVPVTGAAAPGQLDAAFVVPIAVATRPSCTAALSCAVHTVADVLTTW